MSAALTAEVAGDPLALDRLARHKAGAPSPTQQMSRSPFRFGGSPDASPAPSAAESRPANATPAAAAMEPEPAVPMLVGIVIADQAQGGGRTAVFTTIDGTVEFGALDDVVLAGRYRVGALEGDSVTLVNTRTGELKSQTLR